MASAVERNTRELPPTKPSENKKKNDDDDDVSVYRTRF